MPDHAPRPAPRIVATGSSPITTERGLLGLPGRFVWPGQDRHVRRAFANAGLEAIAELPSRPGG